MNLKSEGQTLVEWCICSLVTISCLFAAGSWVQSHAITFRCKHDVFESTLNYMTGRKGLGKQSRQVRIHNQGTRIIGELQCGSTTERVCFQTLPF